MALVSATGLFQSPQQRIRSLKLKLDALCQASYTLAQQLQLLGAAGDAAGEWCSVAATGPAAICSLAPGGAFHENSLRSRHPDDTSTSDSRVAPGSMSLVPAPGSRGTGAPPRPASSDPQARSMEELRAMPRSSVLELCCTLQRRLKTARLSNSSARTALSDGVAAVQRQSDAVAKEAEGLLQQATASSELVLQGTHAAAHEHGGDAPPLSSSVVDISSDSVLRRWAELRRRSTLDSHDAELLAVLSYTREVAIRLESERANGQTLRARLAATVEPLRAAQALREEVIASNAAATEARRVAAQRMEDISKAMEETHQAMLRADAQHASQLAERDALLTRQETHARIWLKLAKQAEQKVRGALEDLQKNVEQVDAVDASRYGPKMAAEIRMARKDLVQFVQK
ncbi:unnamed protein product, partial [Symbiodinium sp. KB8]